MKELKEQIEQEKEAILKKEEMERATYSNNNFWNNTSLEEQFDIDQLMEEMEWVQQGRDFTQSWSKYVDEIIEFTSE